jgi:hypothetical protein
LRLIFDDEKDFASQNPMETNNYHILEGRKTTFAAANSIW